MPAAPPNAPSGSPDDPSSHWTGPTKGGVEYTNDASPVPLRIGRYSVIKLIGSGGMGAVYEAEQAQPKRRVALKLIRQAFAGESARVRFQQESQHLADLDHPAIAKVYEAGTQTQDIGGPIAFIAMEYVHGAEAITRFARKRNLPLRARLELVAQVCDALHHAHERGVIHRDIKPGNIVVSDTGQLKVIDFGVARAELLAGERRPGVTLDGQMIGTLEYMAPEQCLADPNDPNAIDRRTDVYALGLLLYELVVGFMPYDVSRADIPTAINVIRETPPEPPRKSNPDLPKDVETIMLKALRKARDERYATAKDMADDLRRFLNDEAVVARPESLSEQAARAARKAATRRPVSTILLFTLVASVIATAIVLPLSFTLLAPFSVWCSTAIARLAPAPPAATLDRLVIIGRDAGTGDGSDLARRLGISTFDPSTRPAWRLLHGRLLQRLARAAPSLVAFDMYFEAPSDYDAPFSEGIAALKDAKVPLLVAVGDSHVDPEGHPSIAPAILAHDPLWGDIAAQPYEHGPSVLTALCQIPGMPPKPTWGLQIFAHLRDPDARPKFVLKDDTSVQVEWYKRSSDLTNVENYARSPEIIRVQPQSPSEGALPDAHPDTRFYGFFFDPLPRAQVEPIVLPYERALALSDDELATRVRGRVVLVANLDDPLDTVTVNGERQPGVFVQIAAIAALASKSPVLYADLWTEIAIVLAASALGALLALAFARMPIITQTLLLIGMLTTFIVVGSVLAYSNGRFLFEPFSPLVAAIAAALVVRWLVALRRARLSA